MPPLTRPPSTTPSAAAPGTASARAFAHTILCRSAHGWTTQAGVNSTPLSKAHKLHEVVSLTAGGTNTVPDRQACRHPLTDLPKDGRALHDAVVSAARWRHVRGRSSKTRHSAQHNPSAPVWHTPDTPSHTTTPGPTLHSKVDAGNTSLSACLGHTRGCMAEGGVTAHRNTRSLTHTACG